MKDTSIELFLEKEGGEKILNSLSKAVYVTDPERGVKYYNAAAAELLPELNDSQWYESCEFFHPDKNPMPYEESPMAVAIRENRNVEGEEIMAKRPNGEYVRFHVYPSPLHNKEGKVIGGINLLMDVSGPKKNEAELRSAVTKTKQQKRLYEVIISDTPDLVYVFDLNHRFIFANEALLEMWGLTWEESIGKNLREVGCEFSHPEMYEHEIDQVIATKESVQGEVSFPHDKLGHRYYDYLFLPVLDGEDEVKAVAGIARDVTERKQVEQALRKNKEEYRTLISNFPKGAVGLFDNDLRYTAVGGELLDMAGVDPEDRVGNKIVDIYPDEIIAEIEPYFWAAFEGESSSFETDFHDRHLFAQTLPVKSRDDEVIAGMLVVQDVTERWQAQRALRKSEEKYRTLFEKMDEGFCIIKMMFNENNEPINFRFMETNPAYHQHSGIQDKEIKGKTAREVISDIGEDMLQRNGKVALTGEPFNDEIYVEEIDRWLDISTFRIGKPEERKVAVLFNNITERKNNELNKAYLSAIVENSDDAIISKDLNGIITSWNASAEKIFGYSAEEAVGSPITMIIPDDLLGEEADFLSKINQGERINHFETIRKHKDGTLLDVSLTISSVKNSKGMIVGASKIARDITDRKQARLRRKQLLRKVETERERLSDIFQYAPSFMCILREPNHIVERVNDRFMALVGDRDVIGKPVREAIPEAVEPGFIEMLNQVFKTGEHVVGSDMSIILQRQNSGQAAEKRYLDYVFQPIREPDGTVSGVFVQGVDITERKQAKEELKSINESLEERVEKRTETLLSYQKQLRSLASQLSLAEENQRQQLASELHDNLGQLLAVGKMKADLLEKNQFPETSLKDINDLQEIISDALTYTYELMSDLKPPSSIDSDMIASVEWVAEKLSKHGLKVTIRDDGGPKPISGEVRSIVLQSVRELLFNVVKHTAKKEAVVSIKSDEEQLHISVKDMGKGFDAENMEWAPNKQGGFGLFNIYERIDLLGGRMDIDSEAGKGTEVVLKIPFTEKTETGSKKAEGSQQLKKTKPAEVKHEEKIRVLLVDDHKMVREGLRKVIEEHNDIIVIGEAADGKEAIELTWETSPDVILMDVSMPVMDGIEATRIIKADMPSIRIIGVSLHEENGVIEEMRNAGASAYLTKTEAFESVIATIRAEASAQKDTT